MTYDNLNICTCRLLILDFHLLANTIQVKSPREPPLSYGYNDLLSNGYCTGQRPALFLPEAAAVWGSPRPGRAEPRASTEPLSPQGPRSAGTGRAPRRQRR